MVRIHITDKVKEAVKNHLKHYQESILTELESHNNGSDLRKSIFKFLIKKNKKILTGIPEDLLCIIRCFECILNSYGYDFDSKDDEILDIKEDIKKVYNYRAFTKNDIKKPWDAYKLAKLLSVNVCPYCNRNYTYTVVTNKKNIVRPEFDHFYSQSRYPFLALSFFNLVPSCHTCNHIKRSIDVVGENYHHPYTKGFHKETRFTSGITVEDFLAKGHKAAITISIDTTHSFNVECFRLNEIYKHHKDIAIDIFEKSQFYSRKNLDAFKALLNNSNPGEDYYFFLGNYCDEQDFGKRPLAKLTHDIAYETGLLERILGKP